MPGSGCCCCCCLPVSAVVVAGEVKALQRESTGDVKVKLVPMVGCGVLPEYSVVGFGVNKSISSIYLLSL